MQLLAAARLIQLSSVFVAEVQTQATLMLGTTGEEKISPKVPRVVSYSTPHKINHYMPSVHHIWGKEKTSALYIKCKIT